MAFDPCHKWLAIHPKDQPPNHYRLLALDLYESDLDVIEGAADRAMGYVRQYQSGEHAALAAKLLNEIASARLCLLKPVSKADYDAKLRQILASQEKPKVDDAPDQFDAELSNLMSVPKSSAPKMSAPKTSGRSKRKKTKQTPGRWVVAGIGAVVCLATIGVMMKSGGSSRELTPPEKSALESELKSKSKSNLDSAPAQTVAPQPVASKTSPKIALLDSKLMTDSIGPPVDLLREVVLPRDALSGEWKLQGTTLNGGPNGTIYLPVQTPADYQLNFKVERVAGNDTLLIGFPIEGRIGAVEFDGFSSACSGLYVDGHPSATNCTTHKGPVFRNDSVSAIVITVHPGHFHAAVDGKTIVDWYGKAERLISFSDRGEVNREQPFLTVVSSPFQIQSAAMVPIKSEQKSRVAQLKTSLDLTPLIDLARDAPSGGWALGANRLTSPEGWNRVRLPAEVPEEYTLSATIERPLDSGSDATLIFGLVAGGSFCQVVALTQGGFGLETIDGLRWNSNETHGTGYQLKPTELAKVALTVTKQGIRYDFDGRTLIDWRGDFRRLTQPHDYYLSDARALFLGTCAKYIFHDLTSDQPSAGDVFLIVNTSSARCLSINDGKIIQGPYPSKAGSAERWKFVAAGEEFKLFNEHSGKVRRYKQAIKSLHDDNSPNDSKQLIV